MVKLRTTKKVMRDGYYRILSIGYCDAETLLSYESPHAYSAGAYGWACDYYDIDGVLISTGYAPLSDKNMRHDYALIREYNQKAREIKQGENARDERRKLIKEMIEALKV